ncbi:methyltransferase [Klebsiella pneumoniae]|uniref:Methyltransferase n=1 Tax=Klebsiella pneumoniae TaxID=573 RepID=A0A377UW94_KLEPN|nr:methyltransferase [Klebsiella pneumoniae]
MIDIPRIFTISESEHRIHNPFTPEKYATLGRALRMAPGTTILDLGSGSGEMLCSWARDHQIVGTGVDMSLLFSQQAAARAEELGVSDRVTFVHQDASGYVASQPCDVAACVGATWIGGGGGRHNRAAEAEPYPRRHVAYRLSHGWRKRPATAEEADCLRRAVTR